MAITSTINVKDQDLLASLKAFCVSILEQETISAILVPQRLPMKSMVMPTLVTAADQLDGVDPLSPAFPHERGQSPGQADPPTIRWENCGDDAALRNPGLH